MNEVRERILTIPYKEFAEHKDSITFRICDKYFEDWKNEVNGIKLDSSEVEVVENKDLKDWLFDDFNLLDYLLWLFDKFLDNIKG